jgi:hypothetical protein
LPEIYDKKQKIKNKTFSISSRLSSLDPYQPSIASSGWHGMIPGLIWKRSCINLSRSLSYMCVHVDIYKYGYYNISLNSCYKYKCNSKGDTDIVNYTLNLTTLLLQWNVNDIYKSVLLFIDKNVSYDVTYHIHTSDWVVNQKINIMTTENFNNFIRS